MADILQGATDKTDRRAFVSSVGSSTVEYVELKSGLKDLPFKISARLAPEIL